MPFCLHGMKYFVIISGQVARDIAREGDASPTGVYKQKFPVFKAKMTLKGALLSPFSQNFPGGHAPLPP